ncbi:hypothetical protein PFISCL1PPCAC_19218, partial [Pristionchus fissidentatus]
MLSREISLSLHSVFSSKNQFLFRFFSLFTVSNIRWREWAMHINRFNSNRRRMERRCSTMRIPSRETSKFVSSMVFSSLNFEYAEISQREIDSDSEWGGSCLKKELLMPRRTSK